MFYSSGNRSYGLLISSFMNTKKLDMVVTDLDGTLFNDDHYASEKDKGTLERLGTTGVLRVVATGRNLFSANKVLDPDFPIDYLIFSSGAGLIDWSTKTLLYSCDLEAAHIQKISNALIQRQIDFMIHKPIPENHHFMYHHSGSHNPDFANRIKLYEDYAAPLDSNIAEFGDACQFITIIPNDISLFDQLKDELADFKVIRATSPLDGKTMWVEIFPPEVSKAQGARWLCKKYGIRRQHVLAIGNDYNDLDLLHWSENSYVVENAPAELKSQFNITKSNLENGFSHAVEHYFDF